jgi:hypothetical protein
MPELRRWKLGLALLGLALFGCSDTEGPSDAVKSTKATRADETAQAERRALRTLRAFCTGTPLALGARTSDGWPGGSSGRSA